MTKHDLVFWISLAVAAGLGFENASVEASIFLSTGVIAWILKPVTHRRA